MIEMIEQEKKIADMQRLCERAHYILSENWNDYTDKDGYGNNFGAFI